jgi:transposase
MDDSTLNQSAAEEKTTKRHKNKLGFIDPTVAGIDIGDKEIYVAIPDGVGETNVQSYGTTTPELHRIAEALKEAGVQTAVMEATGIYWVPLYEILEDKQFKSVLVDAKSVKNVPGRKTDVVDCQWIQVLYSNGLLRAAFRPPRNRLALRGYVRWRQNIIKARQITLLHLEKCLQLMNIKLSTAVSDIAGVSGMNIIRAIASGQRDPAYLASLRNVRCKKDERMFIDALTGNFQEENLFSLQQALAQYDFLNSQLQECDKKILSQLESLPTIIETAPPRRDKDKKTKPAYSAARKPDKNSPSFDVQAILWKKSKIDFTALPGIGQSTALLIYAELGGTDVSSWKSEKEFASWLKLCPGNNISGGKRRKSKKQPCTNYISQALRMASLGAKKSTSFVGAHIRRITGRTDKPKGIKAGAHKLACLLYNMCKNGWEYHEKGEDFYEKRHSEICLKNLERKAKEFGYDLVKKVAA